MKVKSGKGNHNMAMRLIPHAAAMTEFVVDPTDGVRYTGTCGETAGLALAHVVDPAKYPLNAATLSGIARWEIARHQASANGSEPISSIASWLTAEGITHTNYGYAEPPSFDWRGMLAQWGGIKPIVFEYAHASALPGDEQGVAYHFNTCLGWDTATKSGWFADGDNYVERTGGTALVRYTEAELAAANVCGMLVGEYELGGNMATVIPTGWKDDGKTLTAPNGIAVTTGFRAYILDPAHNWQASEWPVAAEQTVAACMLSTSGWGGGSVQYFQHSALTWSREKDQIFLQQVGLDAHFMRDQIATLEANTASMQAHMDTLATQAQKDAATIGAQAGQIATLTAQVAQLKAQLANAQATPAPAPTPAPAVTPAPTTPADAAALLVSLIYAQADATLRAASSAPTAGQG